MWPEDVGILSMEMYFPNLYVDQVELEEYDKVSKGKYTIGLGQTRMGFAEDCEDIQSVCLTVTKRLLEKTRIPVSKIGLDTTNACYGGTAALFHALNWIESSSWDGRLAIVVCGDLAVYASGPARPTGGAGACAMLIGPNAPLVITRGVRSTYMDNVYDFYKPNMSSEYPIVEGKLSISCYLKALDKCYTLFKERLKKVTLEDDLDLDYFDGLIFHSPFCKLVQKSVARLLFNEFLMENKEETNEKYLDCEKFKSLKLEDTYFDKDIETKFLELSKELYEEKTKPSLLLATEVGNMYTASLYSCLVSYLVSKPIDEIAGQNLLMFSYGSGMAASMYAISISSNDRKGSPLHRLISSVQHVPTTLSKRIKIDPEEFTKIMEHKEKTNFSAPFKPEGKIERLLNGTYYLDKIDDGYKRTYKRKPLSASQVSEASSALNID
ncbi:hypothetical protein RND71_044057 [Anisodus tanguticus]|uniref:Hydroxymethylglutaryl-CoA synthase n=1 Tax=Anisodus tanguticus TaxID=243964 RepID=A0AAE1QN50_9SOLA|nr:hypothetical protein RND71_044057 [Anisodus tanguticus]